MTNIDFIKYMEEQNKIRKYDLFMMVFTNVEGKGSRFLYVGKLSNMVKNAVDSFGDLNYVSRKKQIIPALAREFV